MDSIPTASPTGPAAGRQGADLLADLKSFENLKALKDRLDIQGLDLKELEVLESKVLNDILLLEDIKDLKTIKDPAEPQGAGRKDPTADQSHQRPEGPRQYRLPIPGL